MFFARVLKSNLRAEHSIMSVDHDRKCWVKLSLTQPGELDEPRRHLQGLFPSFAFSISACPAQK